MGKFRFHKAAAQKLYLSARCLQNAARLRLGEHSRQFQQCWQKIRRPSTSMTQSESTASALPGKKCASE